MPDYQPALYGQVWGGATESATRRSPFWSVLLGRGDEIWHALAALMVTGHLSRF
jgi:hypothetical protein